jgi:hypothetical protein
MCAPPFFPHPFWLGCDEDSTPSRFPALEVTNHREPDQKSPEGDVAG